MKRNGPRFEEGVNPIDAVERELRGQLEEFGPRSLEVSNHIKENRENSLDTSGHAIWFGICAAVAAISASLGEHFNMPLLEGLAAAVGFYGFTHAIRGYSKS